MPRQFKSEKPFIEVFCEGESEQAYVSFLKKKFADVAVINCPKSTGLFEEADSKYRNDIRYKSKAEADGSRACRACRKKQRSFER